MPRIVHELANLSGAHFDGANLRQARFYAVLSGASSTNTYLQVAVFDDVNLSQARILNVTLAQTRIENANLSGLSIEGANLSNAQIKQADLTGITIDGVLVSDLFAA